MKTIRLLAAAALSLSCLGASQAEGLSLSASGANQTAALSAAAARAPDWQTASLLASAALDGRSAAEAGGIPVAGGTSAHGSGLSPANPSPSTGDLGVPSSTSWMNRTRSAPQKKPGFWHRFSRTTFGEVFALGLLAFVIAGACMFGGAALAVYALGPGSLTSTLGGLAGLAGGFYLAAKAIEKIEK